MVALQNEFALKRPALVARPAGRLPFEPTKVRPATVEIKPPYLVCGHELTTRSENVSSFDDKVESRVDTKFVTEFDSGMVKPIRKLSPNTHEQISRRVKAQLSACRKNMKDTRELALQLAAARIVLAALEKQAEELDVPQAALDMGMEIAADLEETIDFLGLAKTLKSKGVH
jgi:hypothetical protein